MLRAQVRIPIPTYLSLSLEFLFNLPSTFKKKIYMVKVQMPKNLNTSNQEDRKVV